MSDGQRFFRVKFVLIRWVYCWIFNNDSVDSIDRLILEDGVVHEFFPSYSLILIYYQNGL